MRYKTEEMDDQARFRQLLAISYNNLVTFVLDYIRRKSVLMYFFWSICITFLLAALFFRFYINASFPLLRIFLHSLLGFIVFPILVIPVHEGLHLIPFYFMGARDIRVGMDIKQYIFYVTAHRFVATARQFRIVALIPFIIVSSVLCALVLYLPGLWKWSLSLFLFTHATMCAGDFALLNFYYLNKDKEIYTWDDADNKMSYYYEKINN